MKEVGKSTLCLFTACLLISFILLDIDVLKWSVNDRGVLIALSVFFWFLMFISKEEPLENNKYNGTK